MGKKLLVVSVVIVLILFGVIFWKVNDLEQLSQSQKDEPYKAVAEQKETQAAMSIPLSVTKQLQKGEQNALQRSTDSHQQDVVQTAPPAFGFLPQKDILQVVGLLSLYDKNGPLMKYIHRICEQRDCNIDVDYQAEIADAQWQEDIIGILKLFAKDGIKHGSLFIEANTVKLEGEATGIKSALALQRYLNDLKERHMQLDNHIAIEKWIANAETSTQAAEPKVSDKADKPVVKKNTSTVVDANTLKNKNMVGYKIDTSDTKQKMPRTSPSKPLPVTKAYEKENNLSYPVTQKDQQVLAPVRQEMLRPVVTVQEAVVNTVRHIVHIAPVNQGVNQQPHTDNEARHKKSTKEKKTPIAKVQHKTKPNTKKTKHTFSKPSKDIIAPSYMETSIDLNRKIAGKSLIYSESFTDIPVKKQEHTKDMVAEPKLEILH